MYTAIFCLVGLVNFLGERMSKKLRADCTTSFQENRFHTDAKMGKHSRKSEENVEVTSNGASKGRSKKSILSDATAVDPSLALLFASSVSFLRKQLRYLQFSDWCCTVWTCKGPSNIAIPGATARKKTSRLTK
jgi:hypothetical protein